MFKAQQNAINLEYVRCPLLLISSIYLDRKAKQSSTYLHRRSDTITIKGGRLIYKSGKQESQTSIDLFRLQMQTILNKNFYRSIESIDFCWALNLLQHSLRYRFYWTACSSDSKLKPSRT